MKKVQRWFRKWLGIDKLERDITKTKRLKTIQATEFYSFEYELREEMRRKVVEISRETNDQRIKQIENWYIQIGDWLRELDQKYKLDEAFDNKEKLKKRT